MTIKKVFILWSNDCVPEEFESIEATEKVLLDDFEESGHDIMERVWREDAEGNRLELRSRWSVRLEEDK